MIYILLNCNPEGSNFLGAFSTREKAEEAQTSFNDNIVKESKEFWDYIEEIGDFQLYDTLEKCIEFDLDWRGANTILETEIDSLYNK